MKNLGWGFVPCLGFIAEELFVRQTYSDAKDPLPAVSAVPNKGT